MGYYVINNLIKERINNIAENLNKLAEFLKDMQDNQNAMATKILELEKRLERYERPKN
jgi:prefoldin subunit 5